MGAISLSNLSGLTVTYNEVQFGGSDSDHRSLPPTYQLEGDFVRDDSGRAIVGTQHRLSVQTIFYHDTELQMAALMQDLRVKLGAPGKVLTIEGLGTGLGPIHLSDIKWGPFPGRPSWRPLGQGAWQFSWYVDFLTKDCPSGTRDPLAFTAFNFRTTWRNDFEGMCERTISGYVEIAIQRSNLGDSGLAKVPLHVADEVRDRVVILVPNGFRRTNNTWDEIDAKNRLNFVVTDEALPGDYLPTGVTLADGNESFDSQGPGFNEAVVSLNMTLRVAPDKPRSLGIVTFLVAAITKQNSMAEANPNGTVIPMSLSLNVGKYDRARDTSGTMSWALTKCLNEMLLASGIWKPAVEGSYDDWRASIQHLWGNRGFASNGNYLRGLANEAVVIDLCDNVTSATIGGTPSEQQGEEEEPTFSLECPEVPEDGGWMGHDLRVRILRVDNQSWHRKAISFLPTPGSVIQIGQQLGDRIPIGGPVFSQTTDQSHDVEHHGLPVTYILLQFKGLRFVNKPVMPEIKSVAGLPVHLVKQETDGPRIAFDVLTCPAWFIRGYRIYRVNGYVPDVRVVESETSCTAPFGGNQEF